MILKNFKKECSDYFINHATNKIQKELDHQILELNQKSHFLNFGYEDYLTIKKRMANKNIKVDELLQIMCVLEILENMRHILEVKHLGITIEDIHNITNRSKELLKFDCINWGVKEIREIIKSLNYECIQLHYIFINHIQEFELEEQIKNMFIIINNLILFMD